VCVSSVALILSGAFGFAEPCPEDLEPDQIGELERLPDAYQPHQYDPDDETVLRRLRFKPEGYGDGTTHPVVISIPPTIFREGDAYGVPSQRVATRDLVMAGFLVFQVEHRLAPPGHILHQDRHDDPASGRPPEQTDDIKQQVLAALNDQHCNGTLFLIGGSSGGCHALWVALDPAPGNITDWGPDVISHIKAVVSLSGPTNLPSREGEDPHIIQNFEVSVENYTNIYDDGDPNWYAEQYALSPISLVQNATYIPPTRLFGTLNDTVPHQQGEDMRDALQAKGADVVFHKVNDTALHAFNYWHEIDEDDPEGECVSAEVIAFLQSLLP
jgi:acetyl esterase/lipase